MLQRTLHKDRTEVTFILPADTPPGDVSVVGDFNNWQPGVHTLTPCQDGKRAVTVELPSEAPTRSGIWPPGTTGSTTRTPTARTAPTAACTPDRPNRRDVRRP
ncbi:MULTISPECIES: hypothetical protein [unclassified Streptomyces]|uniref:hypothetical protein n=1 Tax=unclassified Streptomyces TaxID=2593676 RepID=UPI00288875DD|nr:hypothetical protein [Streptomyces sp. DSM 41633]